MIKVSIIGSGNVAHHLIKAFNQSAHVQLVQVLSRNKQAVAGLVPDSKVISDYKSLIPTADVYIISVSDDAIAEVTHQLPFIGRLVVHTSGTKPIDLLSEKNRKGVFYPLQTLSKNKHIDFSKVPICLEAQFSSDLEILANLAYTISGSVYEINSEQRKPLHVAAVFVSNFVNHLYRIGDEICLEHNLPFELLEPLIHEVADKIKYLSPTEAQTGPAKREDYKTIQAHLDYLQDDPQKQEIYKLITQAIISKNEKL